ncbi:hypothetical protein [Streptomyces anulatus]|uniref:hypothetical protein n=1 Tax=Streptomyces anulatus TaxID=1892 RepID=UPI003F49DD11
MIQPGQTRTAPAGTGSAAPPDLNHIYCCNPDLALCGADVSTHPIVGIDDADCVVCLDLEDEACPDCGE